MDSPAAQRYRVVYADPPWGFRTWSDKGRGRSPDFQTSTGFRHYNTMSPADIANLNIADLSADNSVLFMWIVDCFLPDALAVAKAWGFSYKTVAFTWIKTTQLGKEAVGLGYWTRGNPEQCLLFTKGKPKRLAADVRQLVSAPRREHSRKPEEVYSRIERLVAGPYVELFARQKRENWDVAFSNEAGKW